MVGVQEEIMFYSLGEGQVHLVKDLAIANDNINSKTVTWGQPGLLAMAGTKSWLIYIIEMSISQDK